MAFPVNSLRCRNLEAIGEQRTCRDRSKHVDPTRIAHRGRSWRKAASFASLNVAMLSREPPVQVASVICAVRRQRGELRGSSFTVGMRPSRNRILRVADAMQRKRAARARVRIDQRRAL
jgi:hypothetical protein